MAKKLILSNQVKCNICGDEIYSASIHDYKYCKCGNVAVDGGMSYLKRVGSNYTEMSIELDCEAVIAIQSALNWSFMNNRNTKGMTCAIARYLRDLGYQIVKKKEPTEYD